ncbi:uncharacterized protein [Palaemon carinicauda]|uniref:uncharacterized protein n=1 Tax=Palaemon carinicauda TaxID=392227 RepID=UPI0035B6554E
MLNVRDTIIAEKRRCLYLAAALAIVEERQKRLAEAEQQEKATPPRRKTQRKVWVREWLTRRHEFGQLKLAVTLCFLATGNSYPILRYSFRVEASTICKFIAEVFKAIIAVYKDEVLRCPKTEEEWKEVAARFSSRRNYQNCLGAVDGKNIAMMKPPNAGSYYYSFKGFHSIILMAVADATYKFLYVGVGQRIVCRMEEHGVTVPCMMLLKRTELECLNQSHSLKMTSQCPNTS